MLIKWLLLLLSILVSGAFTEDDGMCEEGRDKNTLKLTSPEMGGKLLAADKKGWYLHVSSRSFADRVHRVFFNDQGSKTEWAAAIVKSCPTVHGVATLDITFCGYKKHYALYSCQYVNKLSTHKQCHIEKKYSEVDASDDLLEEESGELFLADNLGDPSMTNLVITRCNKGGYRDWGYISTDKVPTEKMKNAAKKYAHDMLKYKSTGTLVYNHQDPNCNGVEMCQSGKKS